MAKRGLFMLLFLCCLLVSDTVYAATYTMTQQQFSEWKQLSGRQTQITNDLQQRTMNSDALILDLQKKITEANNSLTNSQNTVKNLQDSLKKSGTMLQESNAIIVQMKLDLLNQQKLIDELETLLAKLKKQRSKRFGIGAYVSTESMGLMVKTGHLIMFGGPKHSAAGYEIGASLLWEI